MDEDDTNVKVFGKDDKSLKSLGKLLSNETSRSIMACLRDEPMYINQIAKKLNLQMNLVSHHIKLLDDAELLIITHKKITRKGEKHKHYQVIPNIFINVTETKDTMHEKSFFKRIFRDGIKFVVLGFVATVAFFFSGGLYQSELHEIARGEIPNLVEISPFSYPLLIIIVGLSVFYLRKNKSKW